MRESGKTTMETLKAHHAGIVFASLPRTLREAIYVTRLLKIQFIWIDSLCTIQGDGEDWKKESVTMSQVYSHAVVTIAAKGVFLYSRRSGLVPGFCLGH
jgi:hypothetical protein